MMTAARAAGRINHYKKRTATTPTKKGIGKRISSQQSSASDDSTKSAATAAASTHRDSLAVPDMHPLRKRSGSVPAIKMVTLASEWNMKPPHTRAIKMTWSRLCEPPRSHCKGIVALVERVWDKIDGKDATIKEIFYKAAFVDSMQRRANPEMQLQQQERCERRRSQNSIATLRDHTHFFVSLVSQLVQNLENDPGEMFAHLDKIGRNHAYLKQYGFKSTHWEKIGEYFIDMVVIQDCVRAYPDACRAWTLLVAAMVDRLRAAPRRGSISAIAVKGSKEELNVQPVRIFGSGNIFCPCPAPPRTPRGSVADIYASTRRGSNGEIRVDMQRRLSGGDLKGAMDSLKISDSPPERSVSAETRRRSYCRLEDVAESLIERKNGVPSIDCSSSSSPRSSHTVPSPSPHSSSSMASSMTAKCPVSNGVMTASKCPMAALRNGLPETKSSSALA